MNLGKRADYNDLIWLAIFQMFQISMKYARLDLTFPHFKASEHSFATISGTRQENYFVKEINV